MAKLCGVTRIRDWILVVSNWSSTIKTFTANPPYRRLADIEVDGLKDPSDIVASCRAGCFFVADSGGDCIWRATNVGQQCKDLKNLAFTQFRLANASPLTLSVSVSGSGQLIVTPSSGEQLFIYDETIFSTSSVGDVRTKQLELPDFMRAHHAAETGRGTIIVCHVGRKVDDIDHDQVTEIDSSDGRVVLRSFGGRRGCGPENLSQPTYLTFDLSCGNNNGNDNKDRLYVCDADNRRIVVINWKSAALQSSDCLCGKIVGELEFTEQPTRMCLTSDLRQLVVNTETVSYVYSIQ
jgi:hypothetical protein